MQQAFYFLQKRFLILVIVVFFSTAAFTQQRFSIATDLSFFRNFKSSQKYWAIGQTVHADFHFTPKNGAYAWVSFYVPGKFNNALTASAKSATTQPQQINFSSHSALVVKTLSVGWKRYLKESAYAEKSWALYGYAGFGLLLARIQNSYSVFIDTAKYNAPSSPISGFGRFRRLTLDVGLGGEVPIGGDIFLYIEARTSIPTTMYPTNYLLKSNNAPFGGMANLGIRVLF